MGIRTACNTITREFVKPFSRDYVYGHFYNSSIGDPMISQVCDILLGMSIGYAIAGEAGVMAGIVVGALTPMVTHSAGYLGAHMRR